MAIIVPIIMVAMGAGTALTVGVSLALAATGINAAIDKAASKVFGKDLVKIGNIAGAVFMGAQGAGLFDSAASAGTSAVSEGASAVSGMDLAADAGTAASSAGNSVSAAAGAMDGAAQGGALQAMGSGSNGQWDVPGSGISADQARYGAVENSAASTAKPAGAPTAGGAPSTAPPPGAPPKPTSDSVWDKATGAWKSLGDRGQGALLQVGGNLLSGMANSAAQAKAAADQRAYESKYRSGSGLTQWAPRQSVYARPGG